MKWIVVLLALLAFTLGCKPGSKPQTDLDRFVTEMRRLPADTALDSLRVLAARGPSATYARYELGNRFFRMAEDTAQTRGWNDDHAKALLDSSQAWFDAAVKADSMFVQAWVNLGGVWDNRAEMMAPQPERQLRSQKALDMYKRALTIDPRNENARCNIGAVHMRERRTNEAKQEFMTVLQQNPQSAVAHYHLAVLFAEARIYREAEREWQLAAKYDHDGDIGERSRANIKILADLQKAPTPGTVNTTPATPAPAGH
jgi:tetratricopeptide (TPR) repeat protein